jgi:hypothetical protein
VIAAGVSKTFHMDGKQNLSNVMTKCFAHSDRRSWVAKVEVEVFEKAFVSVKKTLTLLLFTVEKNSTRA